MKENTPENKHKNMPLKQIFDDIKEKSKILGIIFAYRNGELIFQNIGDHYDSIKFASMCASVLEGATELGQTVGSRKIDKIIAELEQKIIIIIECDEETFFIFIVNKESQVDIIFNHIKEYIQLISGDY